MRLTKYFGLILVLFVLSTGCSNESRALKNALEGETWEELLELGLKYAQISEEEILHIEDFGKEKLLIFTKHNGLGVASILSKDGKWYWQSPAGMAGFDESNILRYNDAGIKVKTLSGKEYYVILGIIYDRNITKITFNDDTTEATLMKYKDRTYWFSLSINGDIRNMKVYDS